MKVLLDTHVLLWALGSPERLPEYIIDLVCDEKNEIAAGIVNVLRFLIETQAEEPKPQKLQKSVYQQKIDEVASGKFEF